MIRGELLAEKALLMILVRQQMVMMVEEEHLRIAQFLQEELLVMSVADTHTIAGFFIAERHVMKIRKVDL